MPDDSPDPPQEFWFDLVQTYKDKKHALGRFRLAATTSPRPLLLHGPPREIAEIVAVDREQRTPEQLGRLQEYYRNQQPDYIALLEDRERLSRIHSNPRLVGAQDVAWALINSPAFLFNR